MKSIIFDKRSTNPLGLSLEELPDPSPKANEVLIEVHATTAGTTDWVRLPNPKTGKISGMGRMASIAPGMRGAPLGGEVAGIVRAIGPDVTSFKPGDPVFAATKNASGGWAQFAVANADECALAPSCMNQAHAAALAVGPTVALGALRKAAVQKESRVLIWGASGGVGLSAVQIALSMGAHVAGACRKHAHDALKELGVESCIDCDRPSFDGLESSFDAVIHANGSLPVSQCSKLLRKGGTFVLVGGTTRAMLSGAVFAKMRLPLEGRRATQVIYASIPKELSYISELAAAGAIRPVIDASVPASQFIEDVRMLRAQPHTGKTVIIMDL